MSQNPGANLAMLLLAGFRAMVDAVGTELANRGYEDVRPVHDFAIRAIASGADTASELSDWAHRSAAVPAVSGHPVANARKSRNCGQMPM